MRAKRDADVQDLDSILISEITRCIHYQQHRQHMNLKPGEAGLPPFTPFLWQRKPNI
jgi:hypothetical protein